MSPNRRWIILRSKNCSQKTFNAQDEETSGFIRSEPFWAKYQEVLLGPEDGLPRLCAINLDIITTIAKRSLRDRLATLSTKKLREVEIALHFVSGMEE